jgi:hypothetical protein
VGRESNTAGCVVSSCWRLGISQGAIGVRDEPAVFKVDSRTGSNLARGLLMAAHQSVRQACSEQMLFGVLSWPEQAESLIRIIFCISRIIMQLSEYQNCSRSIIANEILANNKTKELRVKPEKRSLGKRLLHI